MSHEISPTGTRLHQAFLVSHDDPAESLRRHDLYHRLVEKARTRWSHIVPVSERSTLKECLTRHGRRVFLWFNTADGSTHIVTEDLQ